MSDAVFDFHPGSEPLLVSVPHDGRAVPGEIAARMTPAALELPDTDWHVAQLYGFVKELGASVITARYSRYVVDLNRPPDDSALYPGQLATGICPTQTFAGEPLYVTNGSVAAKQRDARIDRYWRPYHAHIATVLHELRARHGYALLWDAHSIASEVPALFDGQLPELNIGTNQGKSCAPEITARLRAEAADSDYSSICNGRFSGGYITRFFGEPATRVHAVQLELAQRSYMDENSLRYDVHKSARLQQLLRRLLTSYLQTAQTLHA